jgi:3-phenylpropionate/cinnamic acid dioxygenase small subunit
MKRAAARNEPRARTPAPCAVASAPLDVARCERFLMHEARLLDDGRFDEWLALFTDDAWYWIPTEPDQKSPFDTVSLVYDDRRLLETRVRRLKSPRIYSQEPPSRTSRIVANVTLEETTPEHSACTVRSKFLVLENRRAAQRLFGGTARHRLVQLDGALRIAWKRVDLLNCDAPLDGILVPL